MGTTFANLRWDPARDINGLLSEYPCVGMGKDAVPMLLAAFKGPFQAKLCHDTLQGIEAQGVFDNETDVGLRLADGLRAAYQAGREKFRAALINTYTQDTFLYRRANWVLRNASVKSKRATSTRSPGICGRTFRYCRCRWFGRIRRLEGERSIAGR
jgi:hypothetical protein